MSAGGPLVLHRDVVRREWTDYNGHMSEAYYVLVFGDATDAFYEHVGMGDAYRRAANASVFVHSCDERSTRQVPPIGSFTSTDTGVALWFRSVISYSTS